MNRYHPFWDIERILHGVNELMRDVQTVMGRPRPPRPPFQGPATGVPPISPDTPPNDGVPPRHTENTASYTRPQERRKPEQKQAGQPQPGMGKRFGRIPRVSVSGLLMLILGVIGAALLGILTAVVLAVSFSHPAGGARPYLVASLVLGTLTAVGIVIAVIGGRRISQNGRFNTYGKLLAGKKFCFVEELAGAAMEKPTRVKKDLIKMLRLDYLPGARMDKNGECLILDSETYQHYLHAQQEMERDKASKRVERGGKKEKIPPEVEAAIRSGEEYLAQIKEANIAIPGVEVSAKISRIEQVTARIFTTVAQHPEQLPEIRRFMNYYLPTTLKLLNAYSEFDSQPVQGENIRTAKAEIEKTLDTIIVAFENLLDSLFQDDMLDISTDISALEATLAQEGLTGDDFNKQKK